MERINSEILLSSLLKTGFDKIDPLLYSYTLAKVEEANMFEFKIEDYSDEFKKVVDITTPTVALKQDADINLLQSNDLLIKLIDEIDYQNVVKEKMLLLFQYKDVENMSKIFSKKEQEILYNEFKLELIPNEDKKVKTK